VVNDRQIILAAEITVDAPDFGHLEPMLDTTLRHLVERGAGGSLVSMRRGVSCDT
jgi:hypothetical protein